MRWWLPCWFSARSCSGVLLLWWFYDVVYVGFLAVFAVLILEFALLILGWCRMFDSQVCVCGLWSFGNLLCCCLSLLLFPDL